MDRLGMNTLTYEKLELAIDVEEFRSSLENIGQTLSRLTFHLYLFRKFTIVDPSCPLIQKIHSRSNLPSN